MWKMYRNAKAVEKGKKVKKQREAAELIKCLSVSQECGGWGIASNAFFAFYRGATGRSIMWTLLSDMRDVKGCGRLRRMYGSRRVAAFSLCSERAFKT